jgi:hypothetical protein
MNKDSTISYEDEPLLRLLDKPLSEISDPNELDAYIGDLRQVATDTKKLNASMGKNKKAKKKATDPSSKKKVTDLLAGLGITKK